jgi:hypothetical protein
MEPISLVGGEGRKVVRKPVNLPSISQAFLLSVLGSANRLELCHLPFHLVGVQALWSLPSAPKVI